MLEMATELFPEARAYTLAHRPGAILGSLEQRQIASTGLSRSVKCVDDLLKRSFLIPGLVGQIPVSCSADIIFNLSLGLSHGIPKCNNTFLWTYLYEGELLERGPTSMRERLFRPYLKNWARKKLSQVDLLWVPTERLKGELSQWYKGEIEVVPPFFKLSDYPLIPSKAFKKDFYLIHTRGLELEEMKLIAQVCESKNVRYRFMGPDEHLESFKREFAPDQFFGDRCSGELAPMLAASRGVIDFDQRLFPSESLKALSQGKRVIRRKGAAGEDIAHCEYTYPLERLSPEALSAAIDWIEQAYQSDEPQKVRAHAMDFHDLKFKGAFQRAIKKIQEYKNS